LQGYAQVLQLCDESVTRPEIRSTAAGHLDVTG
jgi:hypothetical protein